MTTLGNYSKLAASVYESYNDNMTGLNVTAPSDGVITRLGIWAYSDPGLLVDLTTKLVAWNGTTGAVLAQSASFAVANTVMARHERDLAAPLAVTAGQVVKIGQWHQAAGSSVLLVSCALSGGTYYYKAGGGSPSSMAGAAHTDYKIAAYAYFTAISKPNKPTTESYGVVDL
jgi:hypothetical protein